MRFLVIFADRFTAFRHFANRSIRAKLWLLVVQNCCLALSLAGIGWLSFESYQQLGVVTRLLSTQAEIIAGSSTAALSFGDQDAAAEILAVEHGDPNLIEAVIYDRQDRVFAYYNRDGRDNSVRAHPRKAGSYFENRTLVVSQPIRLKNEKIGTICLKSSLEELYSRLRRSVAIVCLVLLVSLGLALSFSSHIQKMIAEPITDLSGVARRIATERNYSVRAEKRAEDEIGILIDSFNEMLSQIESHELARKAAEESLRESEERYALAARGANDGLWDWKFTSGKIHFSPRWYEMLGYAGTTMWSDPEQWFVRIHPSDRDRVRAAVEVHRENATVVFAAEYRMQHEKGHFIWVLSRGIAVRDSSGMAVRMAGSQTDITEGKVADPLTGLPNRLYFIDRLENAIEAARHEGRSFAVLFLDLDRFKLVNDSLGHAAGDDLLMGVADRLRVGIRDASTAGFHGTSVIARLGGDEFAILVNGIRSQADAVLVADCILRQLSSPFQLNGRQMFATVSIGIAMSSDGHSPEDLLRNADTAMYQAKTRGKARLEVFDETMRDRALARLEVETDLRKAISGGQLALFYQPKICLRTHRVAGYEALVRWNHPERGIVGPDEFIRIAEETGLIVPLGRWVLREACRQMVEWHHRFEFSPQPTVSVNVSFKQFTEGDIVEDVRQALAETGLNPRSLTLEMTESTLMSNPDAATTTLLQLRELNIGLEIDDFGTGYSSLSYLNRLPFDTLKIDRSFIKELTSGGDGSDIVKTILELARSMNMDVVAEGVETEDQLRILEALGSNYAQGFYFSKPVPADVTQALLQERYQLRQAFAALQSANVSGSPVHSCDQDAPVRSRCMDGNSDEGGLGVQTRLREEEPQSA